MSVLVTGGAGYIGSHTANQLVGGGVSTVVLDNLVRGHHSLVPDRATFCYGSVGDIDTVRSLLRQHRVQSVIHFAGFVRVDESVKHPEMYYENNLANSVRLLKACVAEGVEHFIFSSTGSIYGEATEIPIPETAALRPANPYSSSKMMFEKVLAETAQANEMTYAILRYFNVAGASLNGKLGQISQEATHLVKVASQAACGLRKYVEIFGDDYATEDGTGVRDYIHVEDLADLHLETLKYLKGGGESVLLNCGYGRGYSVRQVLSMMKKVTGVDFEERVVGRRPGDVPILVADTTKLDRVLGWKPKYDQLETICRSAYEWEKKLQTLSGDISVSHSLQESDLPR